jgi:CDP-diacylglycerol---glycerol-3-phosphate 3-phosphatidyltransferase
MDWQEAMSEHPVTFSDRVRRWTQGGMTRLGEGLHRAGIHPDAITVLGLVVVGVAAVLIGAGELTWGGVVLLLGLPLDAVDGAVARAMKRQDRFGEMLDSSLDRYADGLIFGSLSYYFAVQDAFTLMILALAALLGSFMVSYTRARGEGVAVIVKIGLFSRLERVVVILLILLFPAAFGLPILEIGVVILAVGTNVTGLQRLWYVYRALNQDQGAK